LGVRRAIELGVALAISSDAHDPEDFGLLHFGVAMARRGWATPAHILNTRSAEEVLAWVQSR
ncbi:MAG: DNA polymerase/3'-5' exonuclease PolX, partial [Anaerolineae bacterium]